MGKRIIAVLVHIIAVAIIYTLVLWLFNYIFDGNSAFGWTLMLQGLTFAVIYVPFSNWMSRRRKK